MQNFAYFQTRWQWNGSPLARILATANVTHHAIWLVCLSVCLSDCLSVSLFLWAPFNECLRPDIAVCLCVYVCVFSVGGDWLLSSVVLWELHSTSFNEACAWRAWSTWQSTAARWDWTVVEPTWQRCHQKGLSGSMVLSVYWCICVCVSVIKSPLSSDRQHLSCDVCLDVRGQIIRTVLFCIVYWSCAQS